LDCLGWNLRQLPPLLGTTAAQKKQDVSEFLPTHQGRSRGGPSACLQHQLGDALLDQRNASCMDWVTFESSRHSGKAGGADRGYLSRSQA
jgi:hypothetical protein